MHEDGEHQFFAPGSVVWDLESTDKFDALSEIIHKADVFRAHPRLDVHEFASAVLERERVQSTGFGHGVAVAHGRTEKVEGARVSLGISRRGIEFEAIDGRPVHLIFVIANHPDRQPDYLRILSSIVSLVRSETFRREILDCMSTSQVEDKLCAALSRLMQRTSVYGT